MSDLKSAVQSKIWATRFGVRSKLALLALSEICEVREGFLLEAPADVFYQLSPRMSRKLSSVICEVKRMESQRILTVRPSLTGYQFQFTFDQARSHHKTGITAWSEN